MYSKTIMYLKSSKAGPRSHEARYWGRAQGTLDRLLLLLGWISLLCLAPMLWIWLLYGSGLSAGLIYAAAAAVCTLVAGIGFAMIRILDGRR
jgi:hypothetical protein